jgi:hypothetical protein
MFTTLLSREFAGRSNMWRSCSLLILLFVLTATAAAGPAISRGELLLQISGDECMRRALTAFQSEGYAPTLQGANLYLGQKDIHSAYIMCNAAPEGKIWVNIVVASEAQQGTVPGAERVKLEKRMSSAASTATIQKSCWRWDVELKNGSRVDAILVMTSDGKARFDKWGLDGTWTANGQQYYFDWGRGPGKQDSMTLSGNTLSGSNFETNWIRGTLISCP